MDLFGGAAKRLDRLRQAECARIGRGDGIALAAVLVQEGLINLAVEVPMATWAIALAIAVPAALAAACIVLAVRPQWDPLKLDERGRRAYVYAAEALAAALFLHVRLAMPWLFHYWLRQYWMLAVMGVAFVSRG